ncbi:MAG: hypothetical protein H6577_27675 [Lewinellaceae bacterium]|nr:hypothetical protein [Saprospiraceae bacterium]MCB9341925.1 hypothetical protein [Lewinellaceae bacterium]
MKQMIFFFALQLTAVSIWAQPGYQVVEGPHWLGKKFVNAYTINVLNANPDDLAQAWSAKLLKAGGQKIETQDGQVYHCQNVGFPALSEKPVEVFFQTYGDGATGAYLTVWLKQGEHYLSTKGNSAAFMPISRLLIQFSFDLEDQMRVQNRKDDIERANDLFPNQPSKTKG